MTVLATDFTQFTSLRAAADRNDPAALREVAGQFEALFVQMMMKNMRAASFGDPFMENNQGHEMYRDMMDQQLALDMSRGKGIGIAEKIYEQLGGEPGTYRTYTASNSPEAFDLAAAARFKVSDRDSGLQGYQPGPERTESPSRFDPLSSAASETPAAAPVKQPWSDPESFAQSVWPHVQRAAKALNVSPIGVLAQAALETGWGKSVMPDANGGSSLNLFGIKASRGWQGDSVTKNTLEFENGVARRENAQFRAYQDVSQTFDDYAAFLKGNPRYAEVVGRGDDAAGFAEALQDAGYATDPQYASKIKDIFNGPTMRRVLDSIASGGL